jgi:hypothetical protein
MDRYLDANSHHHQAQLQGTIKTIYNRLNWTFDSEFMEESRKLNCHIRKELFKKGKSINKAKKNKQDNRETDVQLE